MWQFMPLIYVFLLEWWLCYAGADGIHEACPESKDMSRLDRYGNFVMLVMTTLPSSLILYL